VINFKWGIIAAIGAFLISILMGLVAGVGPFHLFMRALVFTAVFFGLGFGLRFVINSFFPELLMMDDSSASESYGQAVFEQSGPQVTMDNIGEYAVPELYKTPNDPNEMGNIEDLIAGIFNNRKERQRQKVITKGVDVNKEAGYNNGDIQELSIDIPEEVPFLDDGVLESPVLGNTRADEPAFTPSFGNEDEGLGGLPDLDMMARAFSSAYSSQPAFIPVQGSSGSQASSLPSLPSMPDNTPMEAPAAIEEAGQQARYKGNRPEPLKGDFNPKELAEGLRAVLNKEK
jgi:hypothetical protein